MILGVGHFEDKLSNDWPRDERSDEPAGARKPGRPRQSGVEERVLQATLEMIDTGVTVTVSEIVERSGVNRGAIYRRWASLTSLIADALDVGRTLPAPINAQTDNIQEAFFHALVDPTSDGSSGVYPARRARARFRLAMENQDLLREYWQRHVRERRSALVASLKSAQSAGIVRDEIDPEAALDLINGVFYYQFVARGEDLSHPDTRARVQAALDIAWRGLLTKQD